LFSNVPPHTLGGTLKSYITIALPVRDEPAKPDCGGCNLRYWRVPRATETRRHRGRLDALRRFERDNDTAAVFEKRSSHTALLVEIRLCVSVSVWLSMSWSGVGAPRSRVMPDCGCCGCARAVRISVTY
jgi:hypothetical protein